MPTQPFHLLTHSTVEEVQLQSNMAQQATVIPGTHVLTRAKVSSRLTCRARRRRLTGPERAIGQEPVGEMALLWSILKVQKIPFLQNAAGGVASAIPQPTFIYGQRDQRLHHQIHQSRIRR